MALKRCFYLLLGIVAGCLVGALINVAFAACPIFPANNVWNTRIDTLPVHKSSGNWVANIGGGTNLHLDFGSGKYDGKAIGIPVNWIDRRYYASYFDFLYGDESDHVRYPVNEGVLVEEGDDHHLIAVDGFTCVLYELFNARPTSLAADSGAVFNLYSNDMRPLGFTSADAAGLPILPGLVRYDEVKAGEVKHALRFTAEKTWSYIWPASHLTSGKPGVLHEWQPPLGARFRLKASYDISGYGKDAQVILTAMKRYGIILADNGGNWYVSGEPNGAWDNDALSEVSKIKGSAFEAVDESCLMVSDKSYAADVSKCGSAQQSKSAVSTVLMPSGVNEWRLTIKLPAN